MSTRELIAEMNPVIRGWGQYFCKAHIRKLFAQLDRWILRRIWSQRFKQMALPGLETAAGASAVRRVGTRAPDLPDSFFEPASLTRFCESWMRENRTSSLSGGRRPAFRRASSDPIAMKPVNAGGGKGPEFKTDVRRA